MAWDPAVDYQTFLEPVAWPAAEGVALSPQWDHRPVIAGTRWPIHIIADYGADPVERATLKDEWPHLSDAQIDTALAYYTAHRGLFARDHYQRAVSREELLTLARALARIIRGGGA